MRDAVYLGSHKYRCVCKLCGETFSYPAPPQWWSPCWPTLAAAFKR